jgi:radical SAM protein with 4Fe4S-binding SPASM domain
MSISKGLLQLDRRDPRLDELPDEVAIEILMGCNLRCPMCPVSALPHSMNGRRPTVMSAELYRRIIDQISDRPRSILLNVFSEPLLHPRLLDFIRIGKAAGHHVAFITNGTKLTPTYSANLIDAGLDAMTLSIDGLRDETYGVMRVGADRRAVMRNLRDLAAENAARGNPLRVEINYIVTSATAPEVSAFWSEYSPLVASINLIPVTAFGNQWRIPEWMPEEGADPRLVPQRGVRLPARTPCPHIWRALWVSAEGRVMLCTNDFEQRSALPFVQDKPLLDIWREDVGRIRREQAEGRFDHEPCRSCWLNDVPAVASPDDRQRAFAAARRRRLTAEIVPDAWLPPADRELRARRDAPTGWVDRPLPDTPVGGIVVVNGWAVAAPGRARVERIEIRIDGVSHGVARYDLFRPDVGEVHPGEGHSFSGFSYSLDTRHFSNGAHSLDALVEDGEGHSAILQSRTIHVEN